MTMTRSPSLAEVISSAISGALEGVHTALPAKVVRYDASTQQADVQPLVKAAYTDEEGERQVASLPVVASVPVVMLTAGGFTFTVPVQNGNTGLLVFAEASLDRWLAGTGGEVDPEIDVRHGLSDGVFLPGLLPFGAPMDPAPPTDHATAGSVGGPRIHFRSSAITIGDESGSKKLGLDGDQVDCGALTLTVAAGVLGGTYVDPFGTSTAVTSGSPIPLKGKLLASASQAKGK